MSFSGHKGVKKHNDFLALGMGLSMQVLERHNIISFYFQILQQYNKCAKTKHREDNL